MFKFVIIYILAFIFVTKARNIQLNNDIPPPLKDVQKFPPIIEHFVQLIQKYFSNYVYEDLSRPPAWDSTNFGMEYPQFALKGNETRNLEKS